MEEIGTSRAGRGGHLNDVKGEAPHPRPQTSRVVVGTTEKSSSSTAAKRAKGKAGNKSSKAPEDWERYEKLSLHEHILKRGDSYVGSCEPEDSEQWVVGEDGMMERRVLRYVPGLFKIFDEILVNAADNLQRDKTMSNICVTISEQEISVENDGAGIRIAAHPTAKDTDEKTPLLNPTLIFGHLLAGDNFNDSRKRCAGGRNGYGAKLANVYSTMFRVETCDPRGTDLTGQKRVRYFKQEWSRNMFERSPAVLLPAVPEGNRPQFTRITFRPDMKLFKGKGGDEHDEPGEQGDSSKMVMDKDILDLMKRRVYDLAGCTPEHVSVHLNGELLPIRTFKDYVGLFRMKEGSPLIRAEVLDPPECDSDPSVPRPSARWEVYIALSEKGFQQISFVNAIATSKGGSHVNHVEGPLVERIWEKATEEYSGSFRISRPNIKSHLFVFINAKIENPTFNSQTKEDMTTLPRDFGSACRMSEDTLQAVLGSGVVDNILKWAKAKQQAELAKRAKISNKSLTKLIVPKLEDANMAGTAQSMDCTLILTEGDSAKATAMAGLGVVGRDYYGVFPLRGKVLNVRNADPSKVTNNAEIKNVCKILGLQIPEACLAKDFKEADRPEEDLQESTVEMLKRKMRYGSVTIMTDQDFDGSHIKGLLLNFLQYYWPALLRHEPQFVREFVTPIVKATGRKIGRQPAPVLSFFTVSEYEQWKDSLSKEEKRRWKVKYYKGLGTSTSKEAKQYFEKLEKHSLSFKYEGDADDDCISMAFDTKRADDRKKWIKDLNEGDFVDHNESELTIVDFVKKELGFAAQYDVVRSVANIIDGFKPGQRKIMYCALKRNLKSDIKVAQLAGYVSEKAAYHHGEKSLEDTIVGMAQDFVGSNNLKLLVPSGQFGTRIEGGKDNAASRYIYTRLNNPLTRALFHPADDKILDYNQEEGKWIEPKVYCPVIPMCLVNGVTGIGTGWSTSIPNFDPRDIVHNCRIYVKRELRLIEPGLPPRDDPNYDNAKASRIRELEASRALPPYREMVPWYRNFTGEVRGRPGSKNFTSEGFVTPNEDGSTVEITELPVKEWTQIYKDKLVKMQKDSENSGVIDFREYHTDVTVHFSVDLNETGRELAQQQGYLKYFGLISAKELSTTNMMGFNKEGRIIKYDSPLDILREFADYRAHMYQKRKAHLLARLSQSEAELREQCRFVQLVVKRDLIVRKRKVAVILAELRQRNFLTASQLAAMVPRSDREEEEEREARREAKTAAAENAGESGGAEQNDEDEEDELLDAMLGGGEDGAGDDDVAADVAAQMENRARAAAALSVAKERREFEYLLGMPLSSLTTDKVRELQQNYEEKARAHKELAQKSAADLWEEDLDEVDRQLDAEDAYYERELAEARKQQAKAQGGRQPGGGNNKAKKNTSTKMKTAPGGGAGGGASSSSAAKGEAAAAGKKKGEAPAAGRDLAVVDPSAPPPTAKSALKAMKRAAAGASAEGTASSSTAVAAVKQEMQDDETGEAAPATEVGGTKMRKARKVKETLLPAEDAPGDQVKASEAVDANAEKNGKKAPGAKKGGKGKSRGKKKQLSLVDDESSAEEDDEDDDDAEDGAEGAPAAKKAKKDVKTEAAPVVKEKKEKPKPAREDVAAELLQLKAKKRQTRGSEKRIAELEKQLAEYGPVLGAMVPPLGGVPGVGVASSSRVASDTLIGQGGTSSNASGLLKRPVLASAPGGGAAAASSSTTAPAVPLPVVPSVSASSNADSATTAELLAQRLAHKTTGSSSASGGPPNSFCVAPLAPLASNILDSPVSKPPGPPPKKD
ncbi:unnamed protein product [Amoebophrya sp. A25]|nr:unnamed protein product [Amoebophrya sp. A25]|eukprot:GSA25T00011008001.1